MFTKFMTGFVAAIILGAAAAAPAIGESSKVRAARPAVSHAPIPSYGIRSDGRAHSTNPAYDVYVDGKYAGSDPDSRIRAELARDRWPGGR